MIINALNCGANVFMADFEDASTPTWANMVEGQFNLADAVRRQIDYVDPQSGKAYKLNDKTATLFVRPRGWHLLEKHVTVDGKPMSGSLFDFGLFFFHNAKEALSRGTGPYFYLPEDGEPSRGAPVERRLCRTRRTLRRAAEVDQGHCADRDHPRDLRDGRDPVGAEGPLGRPQLRPLGLHLQLHQEVPRTGVVGAAGPRPGRHDRALPAQLQPAPDQDLPPPRSARHGRHGGADPDQERSGGQRRGHGPRARRQEARGGRRPRRHLGGASRPGRDRQERVRRRHEGSQPDRAQAPGRARDAPPT